MFVTFIGLGSLFSISALVILGSMFMSSNKAPKEVPVDYKNEKAKEFGKFTRLFY